MTQIGLRCVQLLKMTRGLEIENKLSKQKVKRKQNQLHGYQIADQCICHIYKHFLIMQAELTLSSKDSNN